MFWADGESSMEPAGSAARSPLLWKPVEMDIVLAVVLHSIEPFVVWNQLLTTTGPRPDGRGNAPLKGKNVFMDPFFFFFFTQEPGYSFCRPGGPLYVCWEAHTQEQEASVSNTAHKMEADSIKAKQYFGSGLFSCPIRLQWVFDLPLPALSFMCLRLLCGTQ